MEESLCRGILERKSEGGRADQGEADLGSLLPGLADPRGGPSSGEAGGIVDDSAREEDPKGAAARAGVETRDSSSLKAEECRRANSQEEHSEKAVGGDMASTVTEKLADARGQWL